MKPIYLVSAVLALAAAGCSNPTSCLEDDLRAPAIFASIVTHNEEPLSGIYPDFVADEAAFWEHRSKVVAFANMFADEGVEFNYESDWNFLQAAAMYDSGTVSTNGKNFLRQDRVPERQPSRLGVRLRLAGRSPVGRCDEPS